MIPFYVRFHLEFLQHHKKVKNNWLESQQVIEILKQPSSIAQQVLCIEYLDKFCSQKPDWKQLQHELALLKQEEKEYGQHFGSKQHILIPQVIVNSDGRFQCAKLRHDPSNRLLRLFSQHQDRFLRVEFKVDKKKQAKGGVNSMEMIKQKYLTNGITVAERKYVFLLASDSQMRFNKCWFFAETEEIKASSIRSALGDLTSIENPYTYCARLGLTLSVSTPTEVIDFSKVVIIPDDVVVKESSAAGRQGYCFSDGCGLISEEYMQLVVASKLPHLKYSIVENQGAPGETLKIVKESAIPSAFQIRYAGVKGVITTFPESLRKVVLPEQMQRHDSILALRPSMIKFKSNMNVLEILNIAESTMGSLDRQIIVILQSLGIPNAHFHQLQKQAFEAIVQLVDGSRESHERWKEDLFFYLQDNPFLRDKVQHAISLGCNTQAMLMSEPFIQRVLSDHLYRQMRLIEKKSEIPIRNSRKALGVLDETGILKYGEIFYQYSEPVYDMRLPSGNYKSIHPVQGEVLIAKTPALNKGDVRKFIARTNIPELSHYIDCVVFPKHGPRPHTDEIAGSDLDGDVYFISWEKLLIPSQENHPAFDGYRLHDLDQLERQYKAYQQSNSAKEFLGVSEQAQIEEFDQKMLPKVKDAYSIFQNVDKTGAIFNAHLAFADQKTLDCVECSKLSYAFVDAVRASKHGSILEKPLPCEPQQFPHFMYVQPSYRATNLLGTLFDEAEMLSDTNANLFVGVAVPPTQNSTASTTTGSEPSVKGVSYAPVQVPSKIGEYILHFRAQLQDPKIEEQIQADLDKYMQRYVDHVSYHVSSVSYHTFLDMYEPSNYIATIVKNYQHQIFENIMIPKYSSSLRQFIACKWFTTAYNKANQEQSKNNTKRSPKKTEAESIALSFAWCISEHLPF